MAQKNTPIKTLMRIIPAMCLAVALLAAIVIRAFPSSSASLPYTDVYEPKTSWPLSATVAWPADASVLSSARADVRPATVFVWLDEALKVYDRDGGLISASLDDFVSAAAPAMIPAFYIRDTGTAAALKEYLNKKTLLDCFVVSDPEHGDLVKDVADLVHVRGMLDYSGVTDAGRDTLLKMAASTFGAHGRVILLSDTAATRENVKLLQSLTATVWVKSPSDPKSLLTHFTNGVNGIAADDYGAAIRALEFFSDDAPSLLRIPLIIGHRGMPSMYVENTLTSALGAYEAGADAVENDIQLSMDGEIFILHDDSPARLLGITGVEKAEKLTLAELRAHPFVWDDPGVGVIQKNNTPAAVSRYGTLYGNDKTNVVPTLREYIEAFRGTGLINDTEIKSSNPAILSAYKELVDSYDAWDQFFTITFNTVILDEAYARYPEISMGALGTEGSVRYGQPAFQRYSAIASGRGTAAALEMLYGELDKWNATYNPADGFSYDVVSAGRHRGLTVWPWTYNDKESFAGAYLGGIHGITTNWAWWASDYVFFIPSQDLVCASPADIPNPAGVTRSGGTVPLPGAEAIVLQGGPDSGDALVIWRYRAEMNVDGQAFGHYYLYSNPFTVTFREGM